MGYIGIRVNFSTLSKHADKANVHMNHDTFYYDGIFQSV